MTSTKRKKKKAEPRYEFDLDKIKERLKLTGVYERVQNTIGRRHGTTIAEVFGENADRSPQHAYARGHVFWLMKEQFGWGTKTIAKWFGLNTTTVYRLLKYEEENHGKENRREK